MAKKISQLVTITEVDNTAYVTVIIGWFVGVIVAFWIVGLLKIILQ